MSFAGPHRAASAIRGWINIFGGGGSGDPMSRRRDAEAMRVSADLTAWVPGPIILIPTPQSPGKQVAPMLRSGLIASTPFSAGFMVVRSSAARSRAGITAVMIINEPRVGASCFPRMVAVCRGLALGPSR